MKSNFTRVGSITKRRKGYYPRNDRGSKMKKIDEKYSFLSVNSKNHNLWTNIKSCFCECTSESSLDQWISELLPKLELFQIDSDQNYYRKVLENFLPPLFLNDETLYNDIFMEIFNLIILNFAYKDILNLHKTSRVWWWLTLPSISVKKNCGNPIIDSISAPKIYEKYSSFMIFSCIDMNRYILKKTPIICQDLTIYSKCFKKRIYYSSSSSSSEEERQEMEERKEELNYCFKNITSKNAMIHLKELGKTIKIILPNCNKLSLLQIPTDCETEDSIHVELLNGDNIRELDISNPVFHDICYLNFFRNNFINLTKLSLKIIQRELTFLESENFKQLINMKNFYLEMTGRYNKKSIEELMIKIQDNVIFPDLNKLKLKCHNFQEYDHIFLETKNYQKVSLRRYFEYLRRPNYEDKMKSLEYYDKYFQNNDENHCHDKLKICFDGIKVPKKENLKVKLDFIPNNFIIEKDNYNNYDINDIDNNLKIPHEMIRFILLVDYYFHLFHPFIRDKFQNIYINFGSNKHGLSIFSYTVTSEIKMCGDYQSDGLTKILDSSFKNFIIAFDNDYLDY